MPGLPKLKSDADAALAEWWPAFTAWQESYRNNPARSPWGRYWQGLLWPRTLPDDGVAVEPPDSETDEPAEPDYPLPWRTVVQEVVAGIVNPSAYWSQLSSDLGSFNPPNCEISVRCDQYLAPHGAGPGYVLTILFTKSGETWAKAVGVGPHSDFRAHDWRDVTPNPPT